MSQAATTTEADPDADVFSTRRRIWDDVYSSNGWDTTESAELSSATNSGPTWVVSTATTHEATAATTTTHHAESHHAYASDKKYERLTEAAVSNAAKPDATEPKAAEQIATEPVATESADDAKPTPKPISGKRECRQHEKYAKAKSNAKTGRTAATTTTSETTASAIPAPITTAAVATTTVTARTATSKHDAAEGDADATTMGAGIPRPTPNAEQQC